MATPSMLPSNLRPIDIRKDLSSIADLIELCFKDHLDADGRSYLDQMRKAASNAHYLAWAMSSKLQMPVSGYVWIDADRITGNVSLIPVNKDGIRTYMIANVAVHPDHRRLGIGRALTEKAMNFCAQQGARSVWLQVRDDNQAAQRIYAGLGFEERARRSTWIVDPLKYNQPEAAQSSYQTTRRRSTDWPLHWKWLDATYPPGVRWNLPFYSDLFKPGLRFALWRFFNEYFVHHRTARQGHQLYGVITWTPSQLAEDNLWLAVPPDEEDEVIPALLPSVIHAHISLRPMTLNYPAGQADKALLSAGLTKQNTLVWMEKVFPPGMRQAATEPNA